MKAMINIFQTHYIKFLLENHRRKLPQIEEGEENSKGEEENRSVKRK